MRTAICFLVLAIASFSWPAAADEAERPIILEASALESGELFECRIPINIRYDGSPELTAFQVIARAYRDGRQLAATGVSKADGPLVREAVPGGWAYRLVPLQFSLTDRLCREMTGLRIEFARCVFAERPAEDCLAKIHFRNARPDDPLFLAFDD